MMRRYFLIDYENTNGSGLRGISMLHPSDVVYVYYTNICKNINMEFVENFRGRFVCKKVPSGDQSVDKHIIAKMGQLSVKDNVQIIVVSKDKGYNPIITAYNRNQNMVRFQSIGSYLQLPDTEESNNTIVEKTTDAVVQVTVKTKKSKKKKKKKKIPKLSPKKRVQLNSRLHSSITNYKKNQKIEIDAGWMVKNVFKHLNDEKPFNTIPNIFKSKGKIYEEVYLQIVEPILLDI